jgi:hypothetical protein
MPSPASHFVNLSVLSLGELVRCWEKLRDFFTQFIGSIHETFLVFALSLHHCYRRNQRRVVRMNAIKHCADLQGFQGILFVKNVKAALQFRRKPLKREHMLLSEILQFAKVSSRNRFHLFCLTWTVEMRT